MAASDGVGVRSRVEAGHRSQYPGTVKFTLGAFISNPRIEGFQPAKSVTEELHRGDGWIIVD